jgi:hypothetical protein
MDNIPTNNPDIQAPQNPSVVNTDSSASDIPTNASSLQQPPIQGNAPDNSDKAQKNKNTIKIAAIVVLAAIVIYAAYVIITTSSYTNSSQNPVIAMLSTHRQLNVLEVANTMISSINNTKQFNISYSGSAILTMHSAMLGNTTFYMPLNISYKKYNSTSRMAINANNIPIIGSINMISVSKNNINYICTKSNSSGLLSGGSNPSNFICNYASNATSSMNITSEIKEFNMNVAGVGELTYNNQQCYLMQGNGTIEMPINSASTSSTSSLFPSSMSDINYNIASCISMQYGIPLNLTAVLQIGNSTSKPLNVKILLNEVNMNTNTNPEIAVLPGPVTNSNINATNTQGLNMATTYPTTSISSPSLQSKLEVGLATEAFCTNYTYCPSGTTPTSVCNQITANIAAFANGGSPPYHYSWYEKTPGNNFYSKTGINNSTYSFNDMQNTPLGNYSLIVVATDSAGNTGNATKSIPVSPLPSCS